jgi:hypothetical protein
MQRSSRTSEQVTQFGAPLTRRKMIVLSTGVACSSWITSFCVGQTESPSSTPGVRDQFQVAVLALAPTAIISGLGGQLDQSLFITDKDQHPIREFSPTFRKSSNTVYPTYRVFWDSGGTAPVTAAANGAVNVEQSSHVAGVAKFRRNAAIVAYQRDNQEWNRLPMPKLDPVGLASAKGIGPKVVGTLEWGISDVKWDSDGLGLQVDAKVYYKTPVETQVDVNYHFRKAGNEWVAESSTATVEP